VFRKKLILALDIGSSAIKIVELSVRKGEVKLGKWGKHELLPQDEDGSRDPMDPEEEVGRQLGKLLIRLGINPKRMKRLISSLPCGQVSIRDKEMASALLFEVKKHVSANNGDVLLDYQILKQEKNDCAVLTAVTTRADVDAHFNLLGYCHLPGGILEAPQLSIVNMHLLSGKQTGEEGTLLFLHIGAETTHLCIYQRGGLFLAREIGAAGNQFTRDVMTAREMNFTKAEVFKRKHGVFAGPEKQADQAVSPVREAVVGPAIENLINEIKLTIRYYQNETGSGQVSKILLSGGCALDHALSNFIKTKLEIPLEKLNPFSVLTGTEPSEVDNPGQYVPAMGMALRGLHELFPHQFK